MTGPGSIQEAFYMATTKRTLSPAVLRRDLTDECEDCPAATRMVARSLRRLGIVPNHVEHGLSPDRRRLHPHASRLRVLA
jgi:hypothetical protein